MDSTSRLAPYFVFLSAPLSLLLLTAAVCCFGLCDAEATDGLLPLPPVATGLNSDNGLGRSSLGPGASRTIEMTNSSGGVVDCDWTTSAAGTSYVSSIASSSSSSSTPLLLTWLDANRQPVASIPGLRHVLDNGTIIFPPYHGDAHRTDVHSTEYRCLVSTPSGTALSPAINVRSAVMGGVSLYASDAQTLAGNTAVLNCLVLPSEQSWAIQVTHWMIGSSHVVHSQQTLQPGSKYVVIDGRLHVSQVTIEDSRLTYRCYGRHRLLFQQQNTRKPLQSSPARIILSTSAEDGQSTTAAAPPRLTVQSLQLPQRVVVMSAPSSAETSQPISVYLSCPVVAQPPPKIRWYRMTTAPATNQQQQQQRLVNNRPVGIISATATAAGAADSSVVTELAITPDGRRIVAGGDWLYLGQTTPTQLMMPANGDDISSSDYYQEGGGGGTALSGSYRCRATNIHGQIEADIQVHVLRPLRIKLEPRRQIVAVNDPVELTCNVTAGLTYSIDPPVVRWVHNAADVIPGGRFYSPQPNVLRIHQAIVSDSGVYQCFVGRQTTTTTTTTTADHSQGGGDVQDSAELIVRDSPARLTGVFNDKSIHPGRAVYLYCSASGGSPPPSIVWTLDSFNVPYTTGRISIWSHPIDESGTGSYLNISSVEVDDGGLYCCSLQSQNSPWYDNAPQQHCARLNVYGMASIRYTANRTAVAGRDYVLNCPYSGYPIQSIQWYRQGQVIKETDKMKVNTNGTLRIANAEPTDSGEYTCIVKGSATSIAKRALYVEVLRPPVIEPFSFPSQVQDGGRAQVTCSISSGDLPIQVSWTKDGRPIATAGQHLGVEVQTGEFHSLLIFKKLRGEHSGVYACTARNLASWATHSAVLLVQVPPKWIVEPQDVFSFLEDRPARIPCQVHAMPAPSLLWFKVERENYQLIHSSSVNNKVNVLKDGSLQFAKMTKGDQGLYACRATNNIGNSLSKTIRVNVNVAVKVQIGSGEKSTFIPTGSDLLLRCEANGDPPLTLRWTKADRVIEETTRFHQVLVPSKSQGGGGNVLQHQVLELNVSRVQLSDDGVYICLASNEFGSDAEEIRVFVKELPKAPDQLQVVQVQSRSAEIQWLTDQYLSVAANELPVEYRVQLTRPLNNWSFNYTINFDSGVGIKATSLSHLRPYTDYLVTVSAINSAGVGPTSEPLQFQTLEEAPSGPPRHVVAESKSPRSVLASWMPPVEETWNGQLTTFIVTCTDRSVTNGQTVQRSIAWLAEGDEHVSTRRVHISVDGLLRPAVTYAMTVRAINRMGDGPESEPVLFTTTEATPESGPSDVQCSTLSADAIQVSWSRPPTSQMHGHLQGFRIVYRVVLSDASLMSDVWQESASSIHSDSSPSSSLLRPESKRVGNVLDSILYGLKAFTNYSIQISALNRAGAGPLGAPVTCQTNENVAGPVQDLKVASLSSSSLLVAWLPPTPLNGRVSYYNIFVKDTDTHETKKFVHKQQTNLAPVNGIKFNNLTYVIGQLIENRPYQVSVTSFNRAGESQGSRIVTAAPVIKSAVKILTFSRTVFVLAEKVSSGQLVLPCPTTGAIPIEKVWTYGGQPLGLGALTTSSGSLLNYRWGHEGALHLFTDHADESIGGEGDFVCTASNAYGKDAVTYTVRALRVPQALQHLSVAPVSTSSIRLMWKDNKPTLASSSRIAFLPVLEFVVSYRPVFAPSSPQLGGGGGGNWQEQVVDGNEDGAVIDQLFCGAQYEMRVRARNQVGEGAESVAVRALTRGTGPVTLPDASLLFGFTAGLPDTLFVHLDRWPTGGCPVGQVLVEKRGPLSSSSSSSSSSSISSNTLTMPVSISAESLFGWNALASSLKPDEQPMLKLNDFIMNESYQLRLTAASDATIQTVSFTVRRMNQKSAETGSYFDIRPTIPVPIAVEQTSLSYELLIVISCMSVSVVMLLFSIAAISYVVHKRKEYERARAIAAAAAAELISNSKSEYSLRTVAEQLESHHCIHGHNNQPPPPPPPLSLQQQQQQQNDHRFGSVSRNPSRSLLSGSMYSLRKPNIDYGEEEEDSDGDDTDGDPTPYATFTLKPIISGVDTTRSLMSAPPTIRAATESSHSSGSIEGADEILYFRQQQHYRRRQLLNRSPVPPYSEDSQPYASSYDWNRKQEHPFAAAAAAAGTQKQQLQQQRQRQQQQLTTSLGGGNQRVTSVDIGTSSSLSSSSSSASFLQPQFQQRQLLKSTAQQHLNGGVGVGGGAGGGVGSGSVMNKFRF